jgi:hypothetical protein
MTLKSEKTLDLWPRQARLMLYRELNAYRISAVRTELTRIDANLRVNSRQLGANPLKKKTGGAALRSFYLRFVARVSEAVAQLLGTEAGKQPTVVARLPQRFGQQLGQQQGCQGGILVATALVYNDGPRRAAQ